MTVEMACGNCQGRFVVAAAGTVACPHCGTHLMVGAESFPAASVESGPPESPVQSEPPVPPESPVEEPVVQASDTAEAEESSPETFAGYAGLAEAASAETSEAEPTEAPVQESGESNPEALIGAVPATVGGGETAAPPVAADFDFNKESDSPVDSATISDTIELPDSPPEYHAPTDITETLPDFSSMNFGSGTPSGDESPTEFPSFDVESETPTIEFSEGEMPSFDIGGGEAPSFPVGQENALSESESNESDTAAAFPDFATASKENDASDESSEAGTAATIVEERPEAAVATTSPEQSNEPQTVAAATPVAGVASEPGIPRSWFLILASYASAMTIVCIWLLFQMISGKHQLENLKDPAEIPKDSKKKYVQLYQIDAQMPRGHVLALGESRRFGNILVEPMKVTRGPLQFIHFSSEVRKGKTKAQTEPTLKLWLRLTNQSSDQTIAPLDRILLYTNRVSGEEQDFALRGNTFVCRDSEKRKDGKLVFVYALNANDIWDLRGQNLKPLAPGESMVTYIPAGPEGIASLKGDLTWRVHIRKGYSPSKKGVTTLFEVDFDSSEIQADGKAI